MTVLQDSLSEWGRRARRDLPWRRTRDPWAVLVSELMLQQTQVPRVVPRFGSFLDRFPTPAACASAPAADVVRAWAGLGYNRRALNLHRAATAVVERHDGAVPRTLAALVALPGVGPYTARAVLAFAYEVDVGVVEVNSARVLARAVAGRRLSAAEAQALADGLVPPGDGWAWNSAMLDLGATVCTKAAPACDACPLR
ncbi:MAG TPA: A/G-specific adenine glycosylase, partial [Acidimicrobiales bacterium]|nr:A/G-specific adenine glycosylase [Acidimicrobiales bacterium]